MKKKKIVIICVSIIFGVIVLILATFLFLSLIGKIFEPEYVPKEEIITEFKMNKKSFITISDYLARDEKEICLKKTAKNKFIISWFEGKKTQTLEVSDVLINDALRKIMISMNYKKIFEEGNTIYFIREKGTGYQSGILYLKNGSSPDYPKIGFLEQFDDNWFIYVAS